MIMGILRYFHDRGRGCGKGIQKNGRSEVLGYYHIKNHYEKVHFFVTISMEKFLCKYNKNLGLSLLTNCR